VKYSVLMSIYLNDVPAHLELALESIYNKQTRKPDEIVVVFDGPLSDDLYIVVNNFIRGKEHIVKYFPQTANKGLGEALRIGSEHCSGDYIFRMDSDDISADQRFEKQIAYIEAHPEIDVLGTDIAEFQSFPNEVDMRVRSCPKEHNDIVRMARRRNPMNHVSVCIKRTALEKSGGYQSLMLLEDYYLWVRMIAADCRLANIHDSLVYVRVGNGFDSKRGARHRIAGWKVLQEYMFDHHLITKFDSMLNMLLIHTFVCTPPWFKRILYSKILRK